MNHLVKKGIDPKWVGLGCLLPDVPWILQRLVESLGLSSDPYTTRAYFIAQASLLVTLCVCGGLAFLTQKPRRVFLILGINSFLHLLLDGLQKKLANGVHFFAPISWDLWNVGWFWPESLPTYILTGCGLLYVIWHWKTAMNQPIAFPQKSFWCIGLSLMMFLLYFALPFVFLDGPYQTDNHFVRTFAEKDSRVGKPIEFDRSPYQRTSSGPVVEGFTGEKIKVAPPQLNHSAIISARGTFTAPDEVELLAIHEHIGGLRDAGSILGIILLSAMWGQALFKQWGNRKYVKN